MNDLYLIGDNTPHEDTASYTLHKRWDSFTCEEQGTLPAGKDSLTAGVQKIHVQLPQELSRRARSRFSATPFSTVNMQQQPSGRREWLMLCLEGKLPPVALHQLRLFAPPKSNAEYFRCLWKEYQDRRETYTLLKGRQDPAVLARGESRTFYLLSHSWATAYNDCAHQGDA
jgi:hypothetical protein